MDHLTGDHTESLAAGLEELRRCLSAQGEALARGDLAEVARQAERFDRVREALGPPAGESPDPRTVALLAEVVEAHQRLLAGLRLAQAEVRERLEQMSRRQAAVTAYGQQLAASAVVRKEGLARAGFGTPVGH